MKKQKCSKVFLLLASILSFVMVIGAIALCVMLGFNLLGFADVYKDVLTSIGYVGDISSEITLVIFQMVITALMNLYFAIYYLKGFRLRLYTMNFARSLITQGTFQILLGSFLPALFAIIAGGIMQSTKPAVPARITPENLNAYKFEAMGQAVSRLKELKEKGAISDEEYYNTLNKILES